MDAVDSCGRRVTTGDVVSKAGINMNEVQKALQALAADTHGFLEVSDEGDVLYVFPKDYRSKPAAKSMWIKYEPLVEKIKTDVEYISRVSFGTTLFASIALVFAAIILLLIFSYVFGDGDPNQGIEDQRWKLIGQYIASNGGVITAEELAPYLDVESSPQRNDDTYILPVLLRFDGQPVVDEGGNILYQFPSMQRTAFSRKTEKLYKRKNLSVRVKTDEKYLWENKSSTLKRLMVIGLGALNLFGVVILSAVLRDMTVVQSGFIAFVSHMLPLLQIYACSFFVVPFFRMIFILKTNSEIKNRNRARAQRAQALELPDLSLQQKLRSARNMANQTFIGEDKIVYTTGRDFIEQDYQAKRTERLQL